MRKQLDGKCTRCMLYVHGGAYYFGSVDEHRYQMQRHARKLEARVFAPRYRLAPQFPFPCGLQDCLAAYLYLLTIQPPETILLAGDSAGGGMVTAMMVVLRDQGIPLPAGGILLSPWVDLTHSFPSVAGGNEFDYIPAHGFLHRPSRSWPPPNSDDLKLLDALTAKHHTEQLPAIIKEKYRHDDATKVEEAAQGFSVVTPSRNHQPVPLPGRAPNLSINIDGKIIEIKDQIQMYATNALLSHPLVSPILQPSLGGLPPLLIQVGGGEMLRDEQIYLAHKAAAPAQYPPSKEMLAVQGADANEITKFPPTDVQLQVWEDLCHVAPTLSFTRPAKYMYRGIAQFGAWALARAQKLEMQEPDADDDASIISSGPSEPDSEHESGQYYHHHRRGRQDNAGLENKDEVPERHINHTSSAPLDSPSFGFVGQAGTPLPPFSHHMIRQRVSRHGEIFDLAPATMLPGCTLPPSEIGSIKPGPVRKWLLSQTTWAKRYAKEKRAMQELRIKEMGQGAGYVAVAEGERPPPTALVGRRKETMWKVENMRARTMGRVGLKMWSGWGSKHDDEVVEKRQRALSRADAHTGTGTDGRKGGRSKSRTRSKSRARSKSKSAMRGKSAAQGTSVFTGASEKTNGQRPADTTIGTPNPLTTVTSTTPRRPPVPSAPFKLAAQPSVNDAVSTTTLTGAAGIMPYDGSATSAISFSSSVNGGSPNNATAGIPSMHIQDVGDGPRPVVENGELLSGYVANMRPEPVRFFTAREGL